MARLCSLFQECWAPLETLHSQWTDIYIHTCFLIFLQWGKNQLSSAHSGSNCALLGCHCGTACGFCSAHADADGYVNRDSWSKLVHTSAHPCSWDDGWFARLLALKLGVPDGTRISYRVCDMSVISRASSCFFFMLMSCHIYDIIQVISWYFMSEIVRICWVAPWMLGPADLHLLDVFGGRGRAA